MGNPLVSVIMNCYNSEEYLEEAINSVYLQSFINWEIVFWDNASTDNSAKIAKSFDKRLKYYRGETTVPLGEARNLAVNKANGKYIAFLDCDDLWSQDKLTLQVDILEKNINAGICFGVTEEILSDGCKRIWFQDRINKLTAEKLSQDNLYRTLLRLGCFLAMSSALIRKQAYLSVGGIDSRYHYVEDYDLWLKISIEHDFAFIPKTLSFWRRHSKQSTCVAYDLAYREHMALYRDCLIGKYTKTDFYTKIFIIVKILRGSAKRFLQLQH